MLAAGRTPPNPAELIGSKRFQDFLASLHDHFDWVVVDSPPVMAVTDAALAAHSASGVLFVVGAEMTSRHAAKRALEQLEHASARFVGAVLNKVDLEPNPEFGIEDERVTAVFRVSCATGEGIDDFRRRLFTLVPETPQKGSDGRRYLGFVFAPRESVRFGDQK